MSAEASSKTSNVNVSPSTEDNEEDALTQAREKAIFLQQEINKYQLELTKTLDSIISLTIANELNTFKEDYKDENKTSPAEFLYFYPLSNTLHEKSKTLCYKLGMSKERVIKRINEEGKETTCPGKIKPDKTYIYRVTNAKKFENILHKLIDILGKKLNMSFRSCGERKELFHVLNSSHFCQLMEVINAQKSSWENEMQEFRNQEFNVKILYQYHDFIISKGHKYDKANNHDGIKQFADLNLTVGEILQKIKSGFKFQHPNGARKYKATDLTYDLNHKTLTINLSF